MTSTRLALAAALGMTLTALAVYFATPVPRAPALSPNSDGSAPSADAPNDSDDASLDDLKDVDVVALEAEIARLRSLLDASDLRISRHRDHRDRRIVITQIAIVASGRTQRSAALRTCTRSTWAQEHLGFDADAA